MWTAGDNTDVGISRVLCNCTHTEWPTSHLTLVVEHVASNVKWLLRHSVHCSLMCFGVQAGLYLFFVLHNTILVRLQFLTAVFVKIQVIIWRYAVSTGKSHRQIPDAWSPGRLDLVWWHLTFVSPPQYRTSIGGTFLAPRILKYTWFQASPRSEWEQRSSLDYYAASMVTSYRRFGIYRSRKSVKLQLLAV